MPTSFPFVSSVFSRVTSLLSKNVILSNITNTQNKRLLLQEQISSGKRLTRPSIDPIGTSRALDYQLRLEMNARFEENITAGLGRLNYSDAVLEKAQEIARKARTIMLETANDTSTPQMRQGAAVEVDQMLDELLRIGNTRFEGRYVFAGSRVTQPAFEDVNGAYSYAGDEVDLPMNISDALYAPANIPGSRVFNIFDAIIAGNTDINPGINTETKLSDLNNGAGVTVGTIRIGNGLGNFVNVDLSIAESVGDVIDLINAGAGGIGVSASVGVPPDSITLTSMSGFVSVEEVNDGITARDLGIFTNGVVAAPFDGNDLNPQVTERTPLTLLYNGAGIDPSGFIITNQTSQQTFTATISLAGATTIQDLINRVNISNTYTFIRINSERNGIDLVSRLAGGRLSTTENGGVTASQLGILYTIDRVMLGDLNNGRGIDKSVSGDDFRIQLRSGQTFSVDISNANTVQDVIDLINNDPDNPGTLVATIGTTNNIVLSDSSADAGFNFIVENINNSYSASNLGIQQTVVNPPGPDIPPFVITGTALQPLGRQSRSLFTALVRLREALLNNDRNAISRVSNLLEPGDMSVGGARAEIGGRAIRFEFTKNRIKEENTATEKLLSETRDLDMAEAAVRFQLMNNVLQAGLLTAARIMETTLLNYL